MKTNKTNAKWHTLHLQTISIKQFWLVLHRYNFYIVDTFLGVRGSSTTGFLYQGAGTTNL